MSEKRITDVVENDGSNGEQLLLFSEMEEELKWQSTDTTSQTTVNKRQ